MNKFLLMAAVPAVAFAALPTAAIAQDKAEATAQGTATIVRPVTITRVADLAFGRIVRPQSGKGAVVIKSGSDDVFVEGDAYNLSGSEVSRAKFLIEGEGAQSISIETPSGFEMKGNSGGIKVQLDSNLGSSTVIDEKFGTGGKTELDIGGRFDINEETPTGFYSGEFTVRVAYE